MTKGRRPKLTTQQQLALAKKYCAGTGSLALAREFGVCSQTVLNIIRRLGLKPHPVGRWYP